MGDVRFFVEVSQDVYVGLIRFLEEKGIRGEVSDCTFPGETTRHFHILFSGMDEASAKMIGKEIDRLSAFTVKSEESGKQKVKEAMGYER